MCVFPVGCLSVCCAITWQKYTRLEDQKHFFNFAWPNEEFYWIITKKKFVKCFSYVAIQPIWIYRAVQGIEVNWSKLIICRQDRSEPLKCPLDSFKLVVKYFIYLFYSPNLMPNCTHEEAGSYSDRGACPACITAKYEEH